MPCTADCWSNEINSDEFFKYPPVIQSIFRFKTTDAASILSSSICKFVIDWPRKIQSWKWSLEMASHPPQIINWFWRRPPTEMYLAVLSSTNSCLNLGLIRSMISITSALACFCIFVWFRRRPVATNTLAVLRCGKNFSKYFLGNDIYSLPT